MSDPAAKNNARPNEQQAVRTTIVGGRPPGAGKPLGDVPRGIELLLKKTAVDPQFRQLLLQKRAEAAKTIALELTPSETAMLDAIPPAQLEAIISRTRVDAKLRPILMGAAAAVMLVALGADLTGCDDSPNYRGPGPAGERPDQPAQKSAPATTNATRASATTTPADTDAAINTKPTVVEAPGGARPDKPTLTRGIQPDRPTQNLLDSAPAATATPDTDAVSTPVPPPVMPVNKGHSPDRP